jgi:hypothetical protein
MIASGVAAAVREIDDLRREISAREHVSQSRRALHS